MTPETQTADMPDPKHHWNHPDPAAQPGRDELIGIGRMVYEARAKLGCNATEAAILSEVQSHGVADVTQEQVAQFWDKAN